MSTSDDRLFDIPRLRHLNQDFGFQKCLLHRRMLVQNANAGTQHSCLYFTYISDILTAFSSDLVFRENLN